MLSGIMYFPYVLTVDNEERITLVMQPTAVTYCQTAKRLRVVPLRRVIQQFGLKKMSFRNMTLTSRDIKAVCAALMVCN